MKVPAVLPTVHVKVADDGTLTVDVDGEPRRADDAIERKDLRSVIGEITAALDSPVRVEVEEADGTTYADIATPPETREPTETPATADEPAPGVNGDGFRPGEEVAVAYVIARHTADDNGTTALQLPPALLARRRSGLVLLGMTSHAIAMVE